MPTDAEIEAEKRDRRKQAMKVYRAEAEEDMLQRHSQEYLDRHKEAVDATMAYSEFAFLDDELVEQLLEDPDQVDEPDADDGPRLPQSLDEINRDYEQLVRETAEEILEAERLLPNDPLLGDLAKLPAVPLESTFGEEMAREIRQKVAELRKRESRERGRLRRPCTAATGGEMAERGGPQGAPGHDSLGRQARRHSGATRVQPSPARPASGPGVVIPA